MKYKKNKNSKAVWELFSEYTESSSLHGVKYVGEKKRHWIERFVVFYGTNSYNLCNKNKKKNISELGGLLHS